MGRANDNNGRPTRGSDNYVAPAHDRETRRDARITKKKKSITLLSQPEQTHFVEGHAPENRYGGRLSQIQSHVGGVLGSMFQDHPDLKAWKKQQADWNAEFALREKIKPIKEADADISSNRRRAARRKQKGRVGTLLSETLG